MKRFLIAAVTALSLSPVVAFAADSNSTCSTTKYSLLTQGVKFGDSKDAALSSLKKTLAGKANVSYQEDKSQILISFLPKHRQTFDLIFIDIKGGVVVKFTWSYSNAFQDKLGGPSDALVSVVTKARDKYGMNQDSQKRSDGNGYELSWKNDEGAHLEIMGKDPYTIVVRVECDVLSEQMRKKESDSTNFGF